MIFSYLWLPFDVLSTMNEPANKIFVVFTVRLSFLLLFCYCLIIQLAKNSILEKMASMNWDSANSLFRCYWRALILGSFNDLKTFLFYFFVIRKIAKVYECSNIEKTTNNIRGRMRNRNIAILCKLSTGHSIALQYGKWTSKLNLSEGHLTDIQLLK